uniref:Uncharacterized protein n=1 Tax=Anguilla anguilla TaxID=7936 RepID=A0A0E9WHM5_ANGAN
MFITRERGSLCSLLSGHWSSSGRIKGKLDYIMGFFLSVGREDLRRGVNGSIV